MRHLHLTYLEGLRPSCAPPASSTGFTACPSTSAAASTAASRLLRLVWRCASTYGTGGLEKEGWDRSAMLQLTCGGGGTGGMWHAAWAVWCVRGGPSHAVRGGP